MVGDGASVVDGGLVSLEGVCNGFSDSDASPLVEDMSFHGVDMDGGNSPNTVQCLFRWL
jgi:hypothetical protein